MILEARQELSRRSARVLRDIKAPCGRNLQPYSTGDGATWRGPRYGFHNWLYENDAACNDILIEILWVLGINVRCQDDSVIAEYDYFSTGPLVVIKMEANPLGLVSRENAHLAFRLCVLQALCLHYEPQTVPLSAAEQDSDTESTADVI